MKKLWPISKKKPGSILQSDRLTPWLFLAPGLAGVAIFAVVPFAGVLRRSFFTATGGTFVGLENYRTIFANDAFQLAAGNTLRFALLCIPLLVTLSLFLALFLRSFGERAGAAAKSTFLLPMAIPAASMVLIWKLLFHDNGLANRFLEGLGLESVGFMSTGVAFQVLMVSYLWKNMGYDMVLWLGGLSGIPRDLYEAAGLDGAGRLQCFLHITLPSLTGILFMIFVLSLLNSFKVFREAWLVAGDYPHSGMYMLQHLFNNWFGKLDIDKLSAGAVVTAIVILILILTLKKLWDAD